MIIILTLLSVQIASYSVHAQHCDDKNVYWEQMSDVAKQETITLMGTNRNVVSYYEGNFRLSDDEKTFRLLDELTEKPENENVKALYFYLFNKICSDSDGATSEGLGKFCQEIILNDPVYVLSYLGRQDTYLKLYARFLGYEFYFKEDGVSDLEYNFGDFKKLVSDKIKKSTPLKPTFCSLIREIEKIMKNME
jgi:uncharacterized protein YxeA